MTSVNSKSTIPPTPPKKPDSNSASNFPSLLVISCGIILTGAAISYSGVLEKKDEPVPQQTVAVKKKKAKPPLVEKQVEKVEKSVVKIEEPVPTEVALTKTESKNVVEDVQIPPVEQPLPLFSEPTPESVLDLTPAPKPTVDIVIERSAEPSIQMTPEPAESTQELIPEIFPPRSDVPPPIPSPIISATEIAPPSEDIHTEDSSPLDQKLLRARVTELSKELLDRTHWEGIRLKQMLTQTESEIEKKYTDILEKERLAAELAHQQQIRELEKAMYEKTAQEIAAAQQQMETRLQDTLRAQAEGFSASLHEELATQEKKLKTDAEETLALQIAQLQQEHTKRSLPIVSDLEVTRAELSSFKAMVDEIQTSKENASKLHNLSAATLALDKAMRCADPIPTELSALKRAADSQGDELISVVLAAFPAQAKSEGIPSKEELSAHFAVVRNDVRKAALAPKAAPAFIGQAVGGLLAAVSWAPSGYVSGEGVEEILSRIAFLVDFGDLNGALKELDSIGGQPRAVASSWERSVKSRLEADQALKIIKATTALKHIELVD
eukprot:CAMPEP_0182427748 /NCGR_PEP_ID=MMETSP1167-20130531/19178_1 /TAXON_ID=2988 /ORGANISM="Mallomonas Sp, Strain CCMP3275" /LENGTH=552 /DNA_ID=CAMNT_0024610199 /DNA_START=124 /DNA_END=1782 /DNA_ORIENTATION=+